MPQASKKVDDNFKGDQTDAFDTIQEHYSISRGGVIYPDESNHTMTDKEYWAIRYLIEEWDYGYDENFKALKECERRGLTRPVPPATL